MQEDKIILEFRRAFRKLNYTKSKMTITDLREWSNIWCLENNISKNLYLSFHVLVFAYAEQELSENSLPREIRKTRTNDTR